MPRRASAEAPRKGFNPACAPRFSDKNRVHLRLSEFSEAAHKAAASGESAEVKSIEEEVDRVDAKLWDPTDDELSEIRSSLDE